MLHGIEQLLVCLGAIFEVLESVRFARDLQAAK